MWIRTTLHTSRRKPGSRFALGFFDTDDNVHRASPHSRIQRRQRVTTGQCEVVNFFGPDVGFAAPLQVLEPQSGTLQPSLSYVIESDEINGLPLRRRDPYSLLLTVPGATSDTAAVQLTTPRP